MADYLVDKVVTTKIDSKNFYSVNQSHHCWQNYNAYILCVKKASGDEEPCSSLRATAVALCPQEWVANWDETRQSGKFLGVQEHGSAKTSHHHH